MVTLGSMYYEGVNLPQNFKLAKKWYEKAAESGNPLGINNLGYCYFLGTGVSPDFLVALAWLQKAELGCYKFIQNGDAFAHLTLIRVKEDLTVLHQTLDAQECCQVAELGYHNPMNL